MKTTILLGILALSAVMIIVLLPTTALVAGTECKAIKGTCEKSCSLTTQVDNGKMDCGTKGWFWKVQTTCCTKKPCSDGTLQGSCSENKPKYCNTAAKLVDLPSKCPCPDGRVKKWGKCVAPTPAPVKKTQCNDGTQIGKCSATKPKWCNSAGSLIDSPKTCGCPDGQEYNKYKNKCVTSATPTTTPVSDICALLPDGIVCSGGTCKGGKCVTPTPTPTPSSTPTKTPTPAPTPATAETPKPGDNVKFSELLNAKTALAQMCQKEIREISVRMGNEGSTTWTSSYALVPTTSYNWGVFAVPVSGSVAFGNAATFKFKIAAPSAVGSYPFHWRMRNGAGNLFGLSLPSNIISVKDCGASTPSPTSTPSCSDTDTTSTGTTAVFNYGVKGTCTDTGSSAVCASGCADVCQSSSEGVVGGTLNEYYCYAKRCYLKQESCPSTQKCLGGACVPV